jgi:hypothetical protein
LIPKKTDWLWGHEATFTELGRCFRNSAGKQYSSGATGEANAMDQPLDPVFHVASLDGHRGGKDLHGRR